MNITSLLTRGMKATQARSPELLTAAGISGVFVTAYLTAKSTTRAIRKLDNEISPEDETKTEELIRKTKLVGVDFIPPAVVGTATAACIFGSHKVSSRRTAAAVAAYSITNQAFNDYKDHVVDRLGVRGEEKVREAVVEEKMAEHPKPPPELIPDAGGDVLCFDMSTHRYFRSNMERLKRAENEINSRILSEGEMSVKEFYEELGIWHAPIMGSIGWKSPNIMKLIVTGHISEESDEPCLAITFSYVEPLVQ